MRDAGNEAAGLVILHRSLAAPQGLLPPTGAPFKGRHDPS